MFFSAQLIEADWEDKGHFGPKRYIKPGNTILVVGEITQISYNLLTTTSQLALGL